MCGLEYGVLDNQVWHACDPGVVNGVWYRCGGEQMLMSESETGGDGWVGGKASGIRNCCKVSCVQKLPFATLAMLIAISMLATHTWHASVGPCPSLSKICGQVMSMSAKECTALCLHEYFDLSCEFFVMP